MGESRNIGILAANMIKTYPGEHCLFRGYGLADVDGKPPRRADIQAALAEWIPGASLASLSISGGQAGQFAANISLRGGAQA